MTTLTTPRLLLRPLTLDDVDAHHSMVGSDPAVTWKREARSREASAEALRGYVAHWEQHGFGVWAVIERTTDRLLGHAGLQHLEDGEEVEISYYLGKPAWGRGYATEAGQAALDHGFGPLGLRRIVAVVRPGNVGSKRVLSKLGFSYERNDSFYGIDDVEYWSVPSPRAPVT